MNNMLTNDIAKYTKRLTNVKHIYKDDGLLRPIVEHLISDAAEKALSAGMGGHHHDGGANVQIENLRMFLQGIEYGQQQSMDALGPYAAIHRTLTLKDDPKYQEFLKLKEIYGND